MTPIDVLVVDDAAHIRLLLRMALSRQGCSVTEAESGHQALELLGGGALPDIVLLDVQMPDLDGWETLQRIRQDPATADLPVVLCTVKSRAADLLRGWRLGCDAYLTKPVEVPTLAAVLREVLDRTDAERQAVRHEQIAAITPAAALERPTQDEGKPG